MGIFAQEYLLGASGMYYVILANSGNYFKWVNFYGKWQHFHFQWNINVSLHSLSTDYEQSTEAINMKPTPITAPGSQVSAGVSFFCQPFRQAACFDKLGNQGHSYIS